MERKWPRWIDVDRDYLLPACQEEGGRVLAFAGRKLGLCEDPTTCEPNLLTPAHWKRGLRPSLGLTPPPQHTPNEILASLTNIYLFVFQRHLA